VVFLNDISELGLMYYPELTLSEAGANEIKAVREFNTLGYKNAIDMIINSGDVDIARHYINPTNGVLTTSSGTYRTTVLFIPIVPGAAYSGKYIRSLGFYSGGSEADFIGGLEYIPKQHKVITAPENAQYIRLSFYSGYTTESTDVYFVPGDSVPAFGKYVLENLQGQSNGGGGTAGAGTTYAAIKGIAPEMTPKGEATTKTEVPEENDLQYNDAYLVSENGIVFGVDAEIGDLLTYNGAFNKLRKNNVQADDLLTHDVVIVGAGSGGMGAAYALKDAGYSVLVIEKLNGLGGTACQSWVDTWVEGCPPVYFVTLFNEMKAQGLVSGDIENFYLPPKFSASDTGAGLTMYHDKLAEKYAADLNGKVTVRLNTDFIAIGTLNGRVLRSIYVRDRETDKVTRINAKFFIDGSGDGVLCRSANGIPFVDFFYGQDAQSKYSESIAPVSPNRLTLNEPSLFFTLKDGYDDSALLDTIETVYRDGDTIVKPDYIKGDGYYNGRIVNPMAGATSEGGRLNILQGGDKLTEEIKAQRILEYWKYIKLSMLLKYEQAGADQHVFSGWNTNQRNLGFDGGVPDYIGIRESYRIQCEDMLNQNDLAITVRSNSIGTFIAEGSHGIDFHIRTGLNTAALADFNENLLRPYGIKYGSITPKKLDNVLIASRCYGASQVALASARVNTVLAQLGWAAGKAIKYCLDKGLDNVRDVDISELQSDQYTGFKSQIEK
jgi:hypothetical protein